MPKTVVLPALSAGMENAVISRWLKKKGDAVAPGDLLAEVETDKATMELEADVDATIGEILVADGATADVGQTIAVLLLKGEDMSSWKPDEVEAAPKAEIPTGPVTQVATNGSQAASNPDRLHKASPVARRLARDQNLSLEGISGSGPKGRIIKLDVQRALGERTSPVSAVAEAPKRAAETSKAASPVGIGEYEAVPHSSMRKTIARRLSESKATVPHFYLTVDCRVDVLSELRTKINQTRDASERISINDMIIKAVAHALRTVPAANVIWTDDAMLMLKEVNVSVAVAIDGGLITPIVRNADKKSLGTISSEMKSLASRARENKLTPDEYQGGGFSISNLGMFGIKSFSAIINPPQSAILAIGSLDRHAVEIEGGFEFASFLNVTLSADHRAIDGSVAAKLLEAFTAAIEDPLKLLV